MAQLISKGQRGVNIDMTPMTDLAFLLLTFFILATVLSKPTVMELVYPKEDGPPGKVNQAVTLLLGPKGNEVFYYEGVLHAPADAKPLQLHSTTTGSMLIESKRKADDGKLTVLIKTTKGTPYQNVIEAIDQIKLASIDRYAVQDMTPKEEETVSALTGKN